MSLKDDFAQKIILILCLSFITLFQEFILSISYTPVQYDFLKNDFAPLTIIVICIGVYFNFPKEEWKYSNIILVTLFIFFANSALARKLILLGIGH